MALPKITIANTERERLLSAAVAALMSERPIPFACILLSEISRASIVPMKSLSPDIASMHRDIEIRDNVKNINRRVHLVFPDEDVASPGKVSILSPLGVALIGLSVGDSIEWCTPTGDRRSITVIRTHPQSTVCK